MSSYGRIGTILLMRSTKFKMLNEGTVACYCSFNIKVQELCGIIDPKKYLLDCATMFLMFCFMTFLYVLC
jgi:hypothetical protein